MGFDKNILIRKSNAFRMVVLKNFRNKKTMSDDYQDLDLNDDMDLDLDEESESDDDWMSGDDSDEPEDLAD